MGLSLFKITKQSEKLSVTITNTFFFLKIPFRNHSCSLWAYTSICECTRGRWIYFWMVYVGFADLYVPTQTPFRRDINYFSQTMLNHILHEPQQHGSVIEEILKWPPAHSDPFKFWCITKWKTWKRRTCVIKLLNSFTEQKWTNI